jgi:imidazolonepropionase-like amidohydrolase
VESIPGDGRTLLPGFIDAHTHSWGDALERALLYGVTTELDMFGDPRFAASMRAEQQKPGGATQRADLLSAGTVVTAPKGHGTEYGRVIPTITAAAEAQSFVDARITEGSDYIKIVYGESTVFPTIDRDVLKAVIAAAKKRNKLAVVHIGSLRTADEAIAAGASGLVHIFADAPGDAAFARRAAESRAFVTPTLTVTESATGVLVKDARLSPFLSVTERASLSGSFPQRPNSKRDFANALAATKLLFDAGVPILAGTDAPNPGTAHGASLHRELELLVRAGLSPEAALVAATSRPALAYSLNDRGRIAAGMRADLVLVAGNPTANITDTRDIIGVWKRGVPLERLKAAADVPAAAATTTGLVSNFESAEVRADFGRGWVISTDARIGGTSSATMTIIKGGANGTGSALELAGTIGTGAPTPGPERCSFRERRPWRRSTSRTSRSWSSGRAATAPSIRSWCSQRAWA